MPLKDVNLDVIYQSLANIRLESMEASQQLKDMLLDGHLTTTEILKKIIEG